MFDESWSRERIIKRDKMQSIDVSLIIIRLLSDWNARDIALTSDSVVLLRRQSRTDARSMKMPYVKGPRMGSPTSERETNTYNFAKDN